MPRQERETITIRDADILFRNFGGRERQYNEEGQRNFCVILDDETAERFIKEGWNVSQLKAREEGDETPYFTEINVKFGRTRPPKIVMVTSAAKVPLDEDMVDMLDYADIAQVDMVINPYRWSANGAEGVKGYLKTMIVHIAEDDLEREINGWDDPDNEFGEIDLD